MNRRREFPYKPQLKNGKWSKRGDLVALELLPDTLTVLYDSQEIDDWRAYAPIPLDATAIAVETMDGDVTQIWFSESRSPYYDSSIYERIL